MSTSSARPELRRIALSKLRPHPANPNVMGPAGREKLKRQISRNGSYPPLIVRPLGDVYQIIDGHQRFAVLEELGHSFALCFEWECDDETALLLLASLNRLRGEDVPARRGLLLDELLDSIDRDALLDLIPEDGSALDELLVLTRGEEDPFAALEADAARAAAELPVTLTFVVAPDDERRVLRTLDDLIDGRPGPRSRGSALVELVHHHRSCEITDA